MRRGGRVVPVADRDREGEGTYGRVGSNADDYVQRKHAATYSEELIRQDRHKLGRELCEEVVAGDRLRNGRVANAAPLVVRRWIRQGHALGEREADGWPRGGRVSGVRRKNPQHPTAIRRRRARRGERKACGCLIDKRRPLDGGR